MNENEINKMEVELKKYLDERKIENYAAKRKRIEEEKSSKEDYVKIIAYQTLIGMDRYNEVVKQVKNNLEDNYTDFKIGEIKERDIGYTVMKMNKDKKEVYLFGMRDPRRYRECIKKYLSDCLDITLEERQYTMTTYDDTWSCNVEEICFTELSNQI